MSSSKAAQEGAGFVGLMVQAACGLPRPWLMDATQDREGTTGSVTNAMSAAAFETQNSFHLVRAGTENKMVESRAWSASRRRGRSCKANAPRADMYIAPGPLDTATADLQATRSTKHRMGIVTTTHGLFCLLKL